MTSNEKAAMVAALGLCRVLTTDDRGRVTSGLCPAGDGELAVVEVDRAPEGIRVTGCMHHRPFSPQGSAGVLCESLDQGRVCYHVKALLTQAAAAQGYDVAFLDRSVKGSCPLYVVPEKIVYLTYTKRATRGR